MGGLEIGLERPMKGVSGPQKIETRLGYYTARALKVTAKARGGESRKKENKNRKKFVSLPKKGKQEKKEIFLTAMTVSVHSS